jgi:subtilisin family serine protease
MAINDTISITPPVTVSPGEAIGAELLEASSLVHAGDARNQFRVSGAGLAVAVLDTGINPGHVDFAGRIVA